MRFEYAALRIDERDAFAVEDEARFQLRRSQMIVHLAQPSNVLEAELASVRRDMGEDRYASEFECNPDSPIVGSYYGALMRDADREGRVVPDLEIIDGPIHTAWDLGHGSNMAVFAFQIGDDGLLVHDFIQEDGWFFTNYIEAVKERGYTGKCYVPHDISVKSFENKRSFPPN